MGGYRILNLKGADLVAGSGIGETVKGAYSLIEETTKPILVTNFLVDAIDVKDSFVLFSSKESEFHGHITLEDNDVIISVDSNDVVKILA